MWRTGIKCKYEFLFPLENLACKVNYDLTKWLLHGYLRQGNTSNISRTLVGNKIVNNSDVVGASPVGASPTTSSFST